MIKCPSCAKVNKPAKRVYFAGAKQVCPYCNFGWIEPSLVLKKNRDTRYSRLFNFHQLLRERQYKNLENKYDFFYCFDINIKSLLNDSFNHTNTPVVYETNLEINKDLLDEKSGNILRKLD